MALHTCWFTCWKKLICYSGFLQTQKMSEPLDGNWTHNLPVRCSSRRITVYLGSLRGEKQMPSLKLNNFFSLVVTRHQNSQLYSVHMEQLKSNNTAMFIDLLLFLWYCYWTSSNTQIVITPPCIAGGFKGWGLGLGGGTPKQLHIFLMCHKLTIIIA